MNHHSTSATAAKVLPVTARGQKTRQDLLDAAEIVFGEKGYERASIADITRTAHVALGTFYVYFPNKQAIFVELVEELGTRLRAALSEAVYGLSDRVEIEKIGFRTFFSFIVRHKNLYKIVRQAEFVDEEVYRRYYRRMAEGYMRGLERAVDQGQIHRIDPEVLAYSLMGIADFVGMRWVLWGGGRNMEPVLQSLGKFLEHGLAGGLGDLSSLQASTSSSTQASGGAKGK